MKISRARAPEPRIASWSSILDYLPDHILMDILTRLPVKTICYCRCVCVYFRNLILDPDFAKLHLSRSPSTLMLRTCHSNRDLYLVESVEQNLVNVNAAHNDDDIRVPYSTVLKFHTKFDVPNWELEILSSCNGLICFYRPRTYFPYYICNPAVNEFVIVPQFEKHLFDQQGSGFGFSPKTNQYKVLRFLYPSGSVGLRGLLKWETEIITVGTNLWRKIGDAPRYLHWFSSGCFFNGALHWIVHNADNCFQSVCCFDFGGEQFRQFPGPSQFAADRNVTVLRMNMGLLGGCISVFHHSSDHQLDIWVLKDYGVKESWTKEFVIEVPWPSSNFGYLYQPIMFLNNEEILMFFPVSLLLSCNSQGSFRNVRIDGLTSSFKAITYIPSFISIKNAVMGETLKRSTV